LELEGHLIECSVYVRIEDRNVRESRVCIGKL